MFAVDLDANAPLCKRRANLIPYDHWRLSMLLLVIGEDLEGDERGTFLVEISHKIRTLSEE